MFNTNRNILVEDSKRGGCRYFPCSLRYKDTGKPRLVTTLIYYSVQLDATYRNGSFEKNVSGIINLRTCIWIQLFHICRQPTWQVSGGTHSDSRLLEWAYRELQTTMSRTQSVELSTPLHSTLIDTKPTFPALRRDPPPPPERGTGVMLKGREWTTLVKANCVEGETYKKLSVQWSFKAEVPYSLKKYG